MGSFSGPGSFSAIRTGCVVAMSVNGEVVGAADATSDGRVVEGTSTDLVAGDSIIVTVLLTGDGSALAIGMPITCDSALKSFGGSGGGAGASGAPKGASGSTGGPKGSNTIAGDFSTDFGEVCDAPPFPSLPRSLGPLSAAPGLGVRAACSWGACRACINCSPSEALTALPLAPRSPNNSSNSGNGGSFGSGMALARVGSGDSAIKR